MLNTWHRFVNKKLEPSAGYICYHWSLQPLISTWQYPKWCQFEQFTICMRYAVLLGPRALKYKPLEILWRHCKIYFRAQLTPNWRLCYVLLKGLEAFRNSDYEGLGLWPQVSSKCPWNENCLIIYKLGIYCATEPSFAIMIFKTYPYIMYFRKLQYIEVLLNLANYSQV